MATGSNDDMFPCRLCSLGCSPTPARQTRLPASDGHGCTGQLGDACNGGPAMGMRDEHPYGPWPHRRHGILVAVGGGPASAGGTGKPPPADGPTPVRGLLAGGKEATRRGGEPPTGERAPKQADVE
ncbi:hypothetical protein DCS_02090 [Drechmeria coniospora]|uniref:Uncharacterized protein n=1 Tax=Drechmeria coniospora TaxID=98403 RepID=A0A151GV52_DRECN|nr:hypothetical protein DCS_02090 [Drechmeria coniospora]KYK60950.1 hypothetical protein DCS_02090 [Drechmeria coniospora]